MNKADKESELNWNKSYVLKESQNLWGNSEVPYIFEAIRLFQDNISEGVYLDLPCGDGRNLTPLLETLPFVVGSDYSKNALEIAKKRIELGKTQTKNVILLETDVFDLCFTEGQFDGIFCWDLLGHLQEVESAIISLLKILKKNGLLIGSIFSINDSTKGENMVKIDSSSEEYIYENKFYFKFYSLDEVKSLLSRIPSCDIVKIEETIWTEFPHEGYREYTHQHSSWAFTLKKL